PGVSVSRPASSASEEKLSQLRAQPRQDPRLGDPNRPGPHGQLFPDLLRRLALDHDLPERLPRLRMDLLADVLQRAFEQLPDLPRFVVGFTLVGLLAAGRGGGELGKVDLGIRPAGRLRLPGVSPEMVAYLVPRDRPKPVAKGVAGPVLVKGLDV